MSLISTENAPTYDVKAFLQRLQGSNWVTELTNLTKNLWWLDDYDDIVNNHWLDNLYFISFTPTDLRYAEENKEVRTNYKHIKWISHIKADFDIRSYIYEKSGKKRIISDEELLAYQTVIEEKLQQDPLLSTYNAIIFSWNGLRVYWIGENINIDTKTYSAATEKILNQIKEICKDIPELRPDYACTNIARLGRLPGSNNMNRRKYNLPIDEVKILVYKNEDSPIMNQLVEIWTKALAVEQEHIEKARKALKKISKKTEKYEAEGNAIYEKINSDISIDDLVCDYTWRNVAENGINFISNRDGQYTGAYMIPEDNIVVWKWTPHISDTYPVYSPFSFIMVHYTNGDVEEAFERAKKNYSFLREYQSKLYNEDPNVKTGITILDTYLTKYKKDVDKESPVYQKYREDIEWIVKHTNFLLFPIEKIVVLPESSYNTDNYIYKMHLLVNDTRYNSGVIEKQIELDHKGIMDSPEKLKSFLEIQQPEIHIRATTKKQKEQLSNLVRISLIAGYEKLFGIKTSYKVPRIWFDINNNNKFIFSNWTLNLETQEFTEAQHLLKHDDLIKLSYPHNDIEKLSLEESLHDMLDLKKYISSEDMVSSIILWYMIGWIFRIEYKEKWNEFPFLGIEWYTWIGKTSLFNLLSRISWYDRDSIEWVCDSDYAFEVGMSSLWWRFYFFDEIQKASDKLLKYMQAAYNSWVNRKGWANGNRQELQSYRKDCSLVCSWEFLPYKEEALINRFLVIQPTENFLVKKSVNNAEELAKYQRLAKKNEAIGEYLTTDQIKRMATKYYRPRFLNILKNKNNIDFLSYHETARKIISEVAWNERDTRVLNNLSLPITWYLILLNNSVDDKTIKKIIYKYLEDLRKYRKNNVVSSQIINYIISNIGDFCSWVPKFKWFATKNPMIYCKHNKYGEKWILIQIRTLAKYTKDKMGITLDPKHIMQQIEALLGIEQAGLKKHMKAAKNSITLDGTFIPIEKVEQNESLQRLWDHTISYLHEEVDDLKHIKEGEDRDAQWNQPITTVTSKERIEKIIQEITETYHDAPRFDGTIFEDEIDTKPF